MTTVHRSTETDGDEVVIHPVTPARWNDLVELFERRGPRGGMPLPGHCWCMYWRDEQGRPARRKAALKACVDTGRVPGMLAYAAGRPVAWVAVAPLADHGRLERSRRYGPGPDDHDVYAVTCFYVDPAERHTGLSDMLLDAAIAFARDAGASAVDAFPKLDIAPHAAADRRAEENYSWMGRRQSFESRGFVLVRKAGKRAVMRLSLDTVTR